LRIAENNINDINLNLKYMHRSTLDSTHFRKVEDLMKAVNFKDKYIRLRKRCDRRYTDQLLIREKSSRDLSQRSWMRGSVRNTWMIPPRVRDNIVAGV
jgi:hypothetical protein